MQNEAVKWQDGQFSTSETLAVAGVIDYLTIMNYPINYKQISTAIEFYDELLQMHSEAESYLRGFIWCKRIIQSAIYLNHGTTLCVFLFEVDNTVSKEDKNLWVVVGDIPPMYLDTYGAQTTKDVIKDYIGLAHDWITNVKAGLSVEDNYPFQAEPTIEMAKLLESRVMFMQNTLLENMEELTANVTW